MVVGHVRQELDWNDADDLECDGDVLGLTLFEPSIERNQVNSNIAELVTVVPPPPFTTSPNTVTDF